MRDVDSSMWFAILSCSRLGGTGEDRFNTRSTAKPGCAEEIEYWFKPTKLDNLPMFWYVSEPGDAGGLAGGVSVAVGAHAGLPRCIGKYYLRGSIAVYST